MPGWSKPHTHSISNPTSLALFRHKITLYTFNQGAHTIAGGSNGSRGLSPPGPITLTTGAVAYGRVISLRRFLSPARRVADNVIPRPRSDKNMYKLLYVQVALLITKRGAQGVRHDMVGSHYSSSRPRTAARHR